MKLIYCIKCGDLINLKVNLVEECECGNIAGGYINDLDARFCAKTDDYLLLGFNNHSLKDAYHRYNRWKEADAIQKDRMGFLFEAFVIPEPCSTFERVDSVEDIE